MPENQTHPPLPEVDDARLRPALRGRTRRVRRACAVCGRPTAGNRCTLHADTRSTSERGYDTAHQRRRAQEAPRVATGTVRCGRGAQCERAELVAGVLVGGLIAPDEPWDLGHTEDRTGYSGPEHRHCNRAAGARNGGVSRARGGRPDSVAVSARKTWFASDGAA